MASSRARNDWSVLLRSAMADERTVFEFVVVAVVAKGCGALGKILEIGLILLFEESVLCRQAFGDGLRILLGEDGGC